MFEGTHRPTSAVNFLTLAKILIGAFFPPFGGLGLGLLELFFDVVGDQTLAQLSA